MNKNDVIYYRRWAGNAFMLLLSDILVLAVALLLAGTIRYFLKDSHIPPSRGFLLIPVWCAGAVLFRIAPSWGLGPVEELRRIQILLVALFGIATIVMFLSKSADVTSRIKYLLIYLIAVPLIPMGRIAVKRMLIVAEKWGVNTVVYGTNPSIAHVLDVITHEQGLGFIPYGIFEDDVPVGEKRFGLPVLGSMHESSPEAPFAIIGVQHIPRDRLQELLEGPLASYRRLILIPDLLEIPSLWVTAHDFMGVLGLELIRNLLNPVARGIKQLIEIICVIGLAPVWVPFGAIMAFLIWLHDRTFPFYTQERVGRNGKIFHTWKFRSMVADAERMLEEKLASDSTLREEWTHHRKLRNDPRVTVLGRFLRRTSLDELPQLINVLRREMSLVGPRPLPAYHHRELPHHVRGLREQVLPGMTGLWQVSGRSESGTEGMERWDAYYVRNWSVWLDAVIVVRTFRAVIQSHGAY